MPQYTGNIILANVEANQSITVIDGSLTISGDVGSGARITLENSQSSSNQISFGNSKIVIGNISMGIAKHKLVVQGNIHDQANIIGSADMEFRGYLFEWVTAKTQNGNIIAKDLDSNVTLTTHNGNITTGNIGCNSSVKSHNGEVSVGNVSANAVVKSHNGDVSAISYDPSATIKTHHGKRYINGVRSETRRENHNHMTVNMSNLDNFFPSGMTRIINGRVFINGVEQGTTPSQAHASENILSSSSSMPKNFQSYINSFNNKESFQDAFKRLNIETGEGLSCNISFDIPNIPVFLDGQLYDWESLKKLPVDSDNRYTDPMSRKKFTLANIMPGRAICTILENTIKEVEQRNAPTFKC